MLGNRVVNIDGLKIGTGHPVRVESMLKTPLTSLNDCLEEIKTLVNNGCELVRVAYSDLSLEHNLKEIIKFSELKIMADIHFNTKLAVSALEIGCSSIRINPGNMSNEEETVKIIKVAKEKNAVIRVGANAGSLNNMQIAAANGDKSLALFTAVENQVDFLNKYDFHNIILSAKSSIISDTLRANILLSQKFPYPIHIGITEAGEGMSGIVKGAAGIGVLLSQGIGDTIRVSLTEPAVTEVETAYDILRALKIRDKGYTLISCPTCGRKRVDVKELIGFTKKILPENLPDGLTIAIMGCEVNGPREAQEADIGIAGTPGGFLLFRKGKHICSDSLDKLPEILRGVISELMFPKEEE